MIKSRNRKTMRAFKSVSALSVVSTLAIVLPQLSAPAQAQNAQRPAQQATEQSDEFDILFRADTLMVSPVLSVRLEEGRRTAIAGTETSFETHNNYPAFVEKTEIRIFEAGKSPDSIPLAKLDVDATGKVRWTVPTDVPKALYYVYRVHGKAGTYDETVAHELTIVEEILKDERKDALQPLIKQADEASKRTIELNGLMASATGQANPATDSVSANGQPVAIPSDGHWAVQQIVPNADGVLAMEIKRNGQIVKAHSQSFARPKDDWFVVGQGDLTLGRSSASGPAAQVSGDTLAQGSYAIGRAAFYAKGIVDDDVRVTASVDTGETLVKDLFSNFDRKDPSQLLRRLNRDQYYPTYGDDSTLVEDAPTQGRFYLRAQKGDSQFVIGNFTTTVNGAELAQLDRGVFGALLDVNSKTVTDFGERKFQLTGFASDPGTVPGREEFRGTGGSLYYLKRQDVSVGSERVRIEVRDRETGLVLESRDLYSQQDYDFDPFQGRITLIKPLASVASSGNIVREGTSTGNVPVLVVRYEYSPPVASLDGYTLGGRASGWIGDKLRLGLTAQRDTVEEAGQTLLGGDAMFRMAAGTYIKAELAQTNGPAFGQSNSVDGGLSFTDITNPGVGSKALAWRTELAVDFAELAGKSANLGKVSGYFEHFDRGFASAGRLSPSRTERWGLAASVPFGSNSGVSIKYDELTSGSAGTSNTGTIDLTQGLGDVKAKLGLRYEDRAPGLLYNSTQDGSRTDAAMELEYLPSGKDYSLHAFGQATLDRDDTRSRNSRYGVGAKAELTERLSLAGEVSSGDGGLGADVQLNRRLSEGSEAYVGYALFADRTDTGLDSQNIFTRSNRGTLTVGARQRFSDALSVYGENRLGIGGVAPSITRTFGLKYESNKELSFTGSFENGRIDDATTGLFKRTAGSLGVGYVTDGIRIGSNVERRVEKGAGQDQTAWLFRNDLSYELDPDWRVLGRFNLATAKNDGSSIRAAAFTEAMAGLAYRPVNNERFNALLRFTYFEDLGPVGQITGSGQTQSPKQMSAIVNGDINYKLSRKLTLGLKYGWRQGKVSLGRDSNVYVKSDAHLGVLRVDYNVAKEWDLMAEGRALWVTAADDARFGALAAAYRHIGNNVKVGVGYSWSKFADDLTDQSYRSKGPFLNLLGKF